MKKCLLFAAYFLSISSFVAQAESIEKNNIQVLDAIELSNIDGVDGHPFKKQANQNLIDSLSLSLDRQEKLRIFDEEKKWQSLTDVSTSDAKGIRIFRLGINAEQFTQGKLKLEGLTNPKLYINGRAQKGDGSYTLELMNGDYRLLIIAEKVDDWSKVDFDWKSDNPKHSIQFNSDNRKKRVSPEQLYDSETIASISLSPDGDWLLWTKRKYTSATEDTQQTVTEIVNADSLKVKYRWQAMSPSNASWSNDSKELFYHHDNVIFKLNLEDLQITKIVSGIKGIRGLNWYDKNTLIMSWHKPEKKPHEFTKRYRALEDRWSYWRGNTQIYLIDVQSGVIKQVTENKLTSSLLDFRAEENKLLITRSPVDYQKPAHYKTQLIEVNLDSKQEKLLGEYRSFNSAAYSDSGIVFTAGPDFDSGKGRNLTSDKPANNYDGQLYLLDSKSRVQALSRKFKPSISGFRVLANDDVLLSATSGDTSQLYRFNHRSKKFLRIKSPIEVVESFSSSNESKAGFVLIGTSATAPQQLVSGKIGRSKTKVLLNTADQSYLNSKIGKMLDWDFTTSKGNQIDGRVYLPVNFDETKKYPAIIYYYGGTSPVSRAFTGRWPFNLWAAQGYVVYVLQPSGSIGYGQEFSAKHVNAWGIETADDIIESTQAFVKAHPYVDANRLGNMGASYGGFMSMYLATKTDMFRATISHAGISNLTSYWGHGWWGYLYSGVATQGSFPWNKTDFYTQQSPVFHADKVTTPMLLVHGDSDTNVPVGESHQMYTALKLLGKDVELIEFQGDDHHINARTHRLRWWYTILSYFDKELKEQPQWWQHLYPEVN